MDKKHKVIVLSDHPLATSGVGISTRMLIEGMIRTGKYSFKCLGGAMRHPDHSTITVNPDFIIKPVDGFGTREELRHILVTEKPDALLLVTDPRQFLWIWEMEEEIHQICPITYWNLWDNPPYPSFNGVLYDSTDLLNCISHKSYEFIQPNFPDRTNYIPHAFPKEMYHALPLEQIKTLRQQHLGDKSDWFVALWSNRNATRKMPSDVLESWKFFLDKLQEKEGHKKAVLIMHTDPTDMEGPNLFAVCDLLGISQNVWFSTARVGFEEMNVMHNMADTCINIAKAEGFGLCLNSSTITHTYENGFITINELKVGDKVLSADGQFHKVLATASRFDKTLKIKALKRPPIFASNNHPFMVANKDGFSKSWKTADTLKNGDLLCVKKPILNSKVVPEYLDILDYVDKKTVKYDDIHVWYNMSYSGYKNGLSIADIQKKYNISKHHAECTRRYMLNIPFNRKSKMETIENIVKLIKKDNFAINNNIIKVKRFIKLDKDFFELLGWYLAEGSNSNYAGLEFSLHKKEIEIANWIKKYIKETFDINGTSEIYRKNNARFYCSSTILSNLFSTICGNYAKNKKINDEIFSYLVNKKEYCFSLLKGLFMGDGSFQYNSLSLTTISNQLANQVHDLLLHNNILPLYTKRKKGKFGNFDPFIIRLDALDNKNFCNEIGISSELKNKKIQISNYYQDNEYFYVPIRKIEQSNIIEELFDIQVEGTENFVANGVVVHNSSLISLQCGKPVISLKTGGLTRQVVDFRDGTEHGVGLNPSKTSLVGSQLVPFIYEDYVDQKEVAEAFYKIYKMTDEEKAAMRKKTVDYVDFEFKYENMVTKWDSTLEDTIQRWRNKKLPNNKRWNLVDINPSVEFVEQQQKQQQAQIQAQQTATSKVPIVSVAPISKPKIDVAAMLKAKRMQNKSL